MSLMDALDGIFMTKAYGWAFTSPLRKIYYNLTTTSISIFVALVIGTIQIINVLATKTNIDEYEPFTSIANIDLGGIGYFIVLSFVGAWLLSVAVWRFETKYSSGIVETDHTHTEIKIKTED
jgi:high-affinity nickel-transport protein